MHVACAVIRGMKTSVLLQGQVAQESHSCDIPKSKHSLSKSKHCRVLHSFIRPNPTIADPSHVAHAENIGAKNWRTVWEAHMNFGCTRWLTVVWESFGILVAGGLCS